MPTTINADTIVGGAVVTGDTSGVLELQSAGSTKLTVNGSGVSLATALPVASGGTGASSLTANALVVGNGTSALQSLSTGTSGQVLVSQGAGTNPIWAAIASGIQTTTRTSNTQLTSSDTGKLINITSGTFTQTFASASTLGNGWSVYIQNSGTGDITLDPTGSELIDGLTSYVMYPNEIRLVLCDGTKFSTIVMRGFYKEFSTSSTFISPPQYTTYAGMLWGGGGSGGVNTRSAGGGGGACHVFNGPASAFSSSCSVVIGAGGAQILTNAVGLNGGTSSFDGKIYAYGGGGGSATSSTSVVGGGGGGIFGTGAGESNSATTNNGGLPYAAVRSTSIELSGAVGVGGASAQAQDAQFRSAWMGGGSGGAWSTSGTQATGGSSIYGGGGGRGGSNGSGGTSVFGGAGGGSYGAAGTTPAGGGAAGFDGGTGGAGGNGLLKIWGVV